MLQRTVSSLVALVVLLSFVFLNRATLHLLPTLWFRNTWSWGAADAPKRQILKLTAAGKVSASHETLGNFLYTWEGNDLSRLSHRNIHSCIIPNDVDNYRVALRQ